MNRGDLGLVERRVFGSIVVAFSLALATASVYVANRDFQAGAIGFGGIFLVAGLVSLLFAFIGCRLMLGSSGSRRLLSPGALSILAGVALFGIVGSLVMAAIHGSFLAVLPSGVFGIWICVSALCLAIARAEENA
jgi:hypothetical protein